MNRLFAYGTLRPNQPNAHILEKVGGEWQKAWVHGTIHNLDWGPDSGLPALVLDPSVTLVDGLLFTSDTLDEHWPMLDEFEGFQYQRVLVDVKLESGDWIQAWTYQMNPNAKAE
ncbi:gamma-glutamylcyclotransferase family protein [Acinetobacter sp. MD2(2019)]|uniref:gamma-glutamylcyclotransferase family protein n=1 Tax=Acinetobacter sp. MD2(2019) TaxID=2605273 RepID=UPI002D1E5450|nr:gamma-glutamylcyclotransferase family protein [Acinetobacter sp. MD2(2019)]MEB3753679.1 gamma-glutamylcyclotransferase [Acinetobacter sp. MD2(2019)]